MKNLKSKMLLVAAAVAALAVIVPTSATASWTKEGSPVDEGSIQLEGTIVRHVVPEGTFFKEGWTTCEFSAELKLVDWELASINNFDTNYSGCYSEGGLATCKVSESGSEVSFPNGASPGYEGYKGTIVAPAASLYWNLSGNCLSVSNKFLYEGDSEGNFVLTPDDPQAISSLSLIDEADNFGNVKKEYIEISANVTPAGVYGIEE